MANKRHRPEEIVQKLRQVDVLVGQGMARVNAIREARILPSRPTTAGASSMAVWDPIN